MLLTFDVLRLPPVLVHRSKVPELSETEFDEKLLQSKTVLVGMFPTGGAFINEEESK